MPNFLDLVFVEIGVSRVDGSKMAVYNEIVGMKKLVWEASRFEKRNVSVMQLHDGGRYLKNFTLSLSRPIQSDSPLLVFLHKTYSIVSFYQFLIHLSRRHKSTEIRWYQTLRGR